MLKSRIELARYGIPWLGPAMAFLGGLALLAEGKGQWPAIAVIFGSVLSAGGIYSLLRSLRKGEKERALLDVRMLQSHKLASLGELTAGIAHEINNPLAIIGREAEWLEHLLSTMPPAEGVPRKELLESVREVGVQVNRCREITQNLLSFARKMEPIFQKVDVNRLVEDMVKLVETETQGKGIEIVRDYQQPMEPIMTDPPGLRQVMLNLLNNARQAIEGRGQITIRTRALEDGRVQIAVEDTGCGIPREHLPRIFDPFFTTKAHGKGTGLGLSICHGIVDRLGGRIWVRSEPGLGSTFVVELPAKPKRAS
jgi:two-component system NtrC family sensor kinase